MKDEFGIQRNNSRGINKQTVHQEIAYVKVDVESLKTQMQDVNEKVNILENSKQLRLELIQLVLQQTWHLR